MRPSRPGGHSGIGKSSSGIPSDAEVPFDPTVEGSEFVGADRPVRKRRPFGHAVNRRHAEVVRMEPPRLRAEQARAAADGDGVVVIAGVAGADGLLDAIAARPHPGMAVGAGAVAEERDAVVPEMVHAGGVTAEPAPALDDQYRRPSLGSHPGRDAAAGAASDDHYVITTARLGEGDRVWSHRVASRCRPFKRERLVAARLPQA